MVKLRGMGIGLCGPVLLTVRRPPPVLVSGMLREFRVGNTIYEEFCKIGDGLLVALCQRFWFLVGFAFFRKGAWDSCPCIPRVRSVFIERCPASALKCIGPGPLGDALGSFSLVVASVNVNSVCVSICICCASLS